MKMNSHRELKRQLEINSVSLWMKPQWLRHDNRFLLDGVQLHVRQDADSETLGRYSLNPKLHPSGQMLPYGSSSEPRFVVLVDDQDAAFAEASRYDMVALFAGCVRAAYAGSMPRTAYRPHLAPGGPYVDYTSYRNAMGRNDEWYRAAQLCGLLGEQTYCDLESAMIRDALESGEIEPDVAPTPTRLESITAFSQNDREVYITAALGQAHDVSDGIEDHRVVDGQLCCSRCEQAKPRDEFVISMQSDDGVTLTSWGCIDCLGESHTSIPLARMTDHAAAMRWTMHMFDKSYMHHPKASASWFRALWGIFGTSIGNLRPE